MGSPMPVVGGRLSAVRGRAAVMRPQSRKDLSPGEAGGRRASVILPFTSRPSPLLHAGRPESHLQPLLAQAEISRGHQVLGTCRLSSGALPLCWFPGGTGAGRRRCGPVFLLRMLWLALVAL